MMINVLKGKDPFLVVAGILSAIAALLHIAIFIGGPPWYRFFGAGEQMATMAANGSLIPSMLTFFIAVILMAWALYAFSAAGFLRRLPLLRPVLITIAVIYLIRGLAIIPTYFMQPAMVDDFLIWSSVIVTIYGLSYAIGTWRNWKQLGDRRKVLDRREHERLM